MAANRLPRRDSQEVIGLLAGADVRVLDWHAKHTGQNPLAIQTGTFTTLGITKGDNIIASVLYTRYRWPDLEMHMYSSTPKWCNKRVLKAMFSYPFKQLNCRRVTAVTDPANPAVCHFLERLGFKEEGRQRHGLPNGDALLLGMLREECKWV